MPASKFVLGDWNAICQRCGFRYKASQLQVEWTGLRVCDKCIESRHPQDLLPAPRPEMPPPWTSPEPADIEIEVDYNDDIPHICSVVGIYAQADYGTADCATVDLINGGLDF